MSTIYLNESQFIINSYTRTITNMDNTVNSNAVINVLNTTAEQVSELLFGKITSIEIYNEESTMIYSLKNIKGTINQIVESMHRPASNIETIIYISFENEEYNTIAEEVTENGETTPE